MKKVIIKLKGDDCYWKKQQGGTTRKIKEAHHYDESEANNILGRMFTDGLEIIDVPTFDDAIIKTRDNYWKERDIRTPRRYMSTKVFDGFSTVFRQHKAEDTHCRFLHGYGISFKVTFEGALDERNWVWDFGGMKRAKTLIDGRQPKAWMDHMFDHTVIIAEDDPKRGYFIGMEHAELIQLRIIPATGAERFAEFIYEKLNAFVKEETNNRVRVTQVEFMEHGKNAAIYGE